MNTTESDVPFTYRNWPDWLDDDENDLAALEAEEIDVVLIGSSIDSGASSGGGQSDGPVHLRSRNYGGGEGIGNFHPWYDVDYSQHLTCVDMGDFTDYNEVARRVAMCVEYGTLPIVIGGDDTVSFYVMREINALTDNAELMHYDAHADWNKFSGIGTLEHSNWVRGCWELGLTQNINYSGYRAMGAPFNLKTHRHANSTTMRYPMPLYLAVDIDVVDPSEAPGVGCPEAGGLTAHNLMQRCYWLTKVQDVRAVSFTELLPRLDRDHQTAGVIDACIMAVCAGLAKKRLEAGKPNTGRK